MDGIFTFMGILLAGGVTAAWLSRRRASSPPPTQPPGATSRPRLPDGYELSAQGKLDDACPGCGVALSKRPARKTKCKACGVYIYVRSRPLDRERVLVTEAQAARIEEEWSVVQGRSKDPAHNVEQCDALLAEARAALRTNSWGIYRNAKMQIGMIRKREGRLDEALELLLETCVLDANGPSNCGSDPESLREFPPFRARDAFLAPGVLAELEFVAQDLQLSKKSVRERFLRTAERCQRELPVRLPRTPEGAWRVVAHELDLR